MKQRSTAEPTDDGHYVLINGRRWRATDPAIPEEVAAELRQLLMSARRAVKAALKAEDNHALTGARAEVQRCKVALGERGTPWWEQGLPERQARWELGLVSANRVDEQGTQQAL